MFKPKQKEQWFDAIVRDLLNDSTYMADKHIILVLGIYQWATPDDFHLARGAPFWIPEHRLSAIVPFMTAVTKLQRNMETLYYHPDTGRWDNSDVKELLALCKRTLEQLTRLSYSLLPKGGDDGT